MKRSLVLSIAVCLSTAAVAAPATINPHIHTDQFGYRTDAVKVAVLADPQTGFNAALSFSPGGTYQVRRWSDDAVVFTGSPVVWNGGATHAQSGDKAWWFDFSAVTTPGAYYVYDVSNAVGSYQFLVSDTVYNSVLRAAVRAFYYQRCGVAKTSASAGAAWADAACHVGASQDADCRLYNNTAAASTSRNLQGGWHDAGDYNKYVTFALPAVKDLLLAFEESPANFPDNWGLPESGNGIPDILDEVKWELDWLLRMQGSNGAVLSVVGGGSASPPSGDAAVRKYGPATTAATLSAACMFALGAREFKSLNIPAMTTYGTTLETAAVAAWNWAVANPSVTFYNSGTLAAGEQEVSGYDRDMMKLGAASYLYALTGGAAYKTYFDANYASAHLMQWSYAYPFEATVQDALLFYTKAAGATASVSTAIKNAFGNSVHGSADNYGGFAAGTDAYRAHLVTNNYVWGSNGWKSNQGSMGASMVTYNLGSAGAAAYRAYAASYLHYLHGVNPLGAVYLTASSGFGADSFAREFYHAWFADGSALWDRTGVSTYGPAPGFLTGGANPSYALDGCCGNGSCAWTGQCNSASVTPPLGQPAQKSYKDWNASWPQNSWSVTENSNVYQGAYVRLLSKFAAQASVPLGMDDAMPFSAEKVDAGVQLRWTVGAEDARRFLVERSGDGRQFSSIAEKPADARTHVDDEPLPGASFYRIAMEKGSGEVVYSPVRRVVRDGEAAWVLSPNPARERVEISSLSAPGLNASYRLLDAMGRVVKTGSFSGSAGSSFIELAGIPAGVYQVEMRDGWGGGRQVLRLVKE